MNTQQWNLAIRLNPAWETTRIEREADELARKLVDEVLALGGTNLRSPEAVTVGVTSYKTLPAVRAVSQYVMIDAHGDGDYMGLRVDVLADMPERIAVRWVTA